VLALRNGKGNGPKAIAKLVERNTGTFCEWASNVLAGRKERYKAFLGRGFPAC
jgi:hypothetical protein